MKTFAIAGVRLTESLTTFAQNSILAGKVTDENNKPATNVVITAYKPGESSTAVTDTCGLYNTGALAKGRYR